MTPSRAVRAVLSWAFGFALTVTLIATWGRSVTADPQVLIDAGVELAAAEVVVDWAEDTAVEVAAETLEVDETVVRPLVEEAFAGEVGERALQDLVAEVIAAGAAPPGESREVDVGAHLAPIADHLITRLAEAGIIVDRAEVDRALAALDPISVEVTGARPPLGRTSAASSGLGVATLVGIAAAVVSGAMLVLAATDRRAELRSLVSRVAVSALTFALLLQLGAWITDPGGGRMPVRAMISSTLAAKVWVPAVIGLVAAGVSGALWWLRRRYPGVLPPLTGRNGRVTPGEGSPPPSELATPPAGLPR